MYVYLFIYILHLYIYNVYVYVIYIKYILHTPFRFTNSSQKPSKNLCEKFAACGSIPAKNTTTSGISRPAESTDFCASRVISNPRGPAQCR